MDFLADWLSSLSLGEFPPIGFSGAISRPSPRFPFDMLTSGQATIIIALWLYSLAHGMPFQIFFHVQTGFSINLVFHWNQGKGIDSYF